MESLVSSFSHKVFKIFKSPVPKNADNVDNDMVNVNHISNANYKGRLKMMAHNVFLSLFQWCRKLAMKRKPDACLPLVSSAWTTCCSDSKYLFCKHMILLVFRFY